ncbi:BglG family transcription antiterminator [Lactiplantibacillus songbeiensis]|uniref:BglG family transcription antiterminator n=1 Tax=Lactiplantibacillus songbeiensis TaxID=2559920 RepID=A0ABW4C0J7_9LACO|nr:helix-turn-helix domain-containing protein [Lactiplantibacillus songbeiensis]
MDNQDFRLLNDLIANDSVMIDELAANEHVSKRTLLKYIQNLNDDLDEVAIVQQKQQRLFLQVNDYQKLAKLQTGQLKRELDFNDPDKRQSFIIMQLLQAADFVTLDDLAEQLLISKPTLARDMTSLRHKLMPYHAEIVSMTNNGIRLVTAVDYDVPIMIENLVYDYYPVQTLPIKGRMTELTNSCQELHLSSHLIAQIERKVISLYLALTAGYHIQQSIPHFYPLWESSEAVRELTETIEFVLDTAVTPAEETYLLSPLTFQMNDLLSTDAIDERVKANQPLFAKVAKSARLTIQFDFDHFYQQIKTHLLFLINRAIFHVSSTALLPENVAEQYPVANDLAVLTVKTLEHALSTTISDIEVSYLTIYFETELEEKQSHETNTVEVAMVGAIGENVTRFIDRRLKEIFNGSITITSFKDVNALKAQSRHFLLIFTNGPINYNDGVSSIVRISTVFRENELQSKLQVSLVEDAIKKQQCHFTYQTLDSQDGYLKATQQMIEQKIAVSELNQDFLRDWQLREQKSSCVFEGGVAIPHVIDHSDHNRILISVGAFDREIKYQDRKVRLVFLVGIPATVDNQLSRVLSEVYDFIFSVAKNQGIYNNLLNFDPQRSLIQITEGI